MSDKQFMCAVKVSLKTTICILYCLLQTSTAAPRSQNFFNQAAVGTLGAASQVAEFFQNGVAAHKDFNFQMPGFGMHSKAGIGLGLRRTQSSEEDSDEDRRRRRRSIESEEYSATGPKTSFKKILRTLNAPCHYGGTGTGGGTTGGTGDGGDGGEEIIEEARRRMARMRARKAAQAKKAKKNTTSKNSNGRRRRQIEIDDLAELSESEKAEWRAKLSAHIQEFAEKMSHVYENISAAMMDMMKRMGEKFAGDDLENPE